MLGLLGQIYFLERISPKNKSVPFYWPVIVNLIECL